MVLGRERLEKPSDDFEIQKGYENKKTHISTLDAEHQERLQASMMDQKDKYF